MVNAENANLQARRARPRAASWPTSTRWSARGALRRLPKDARRVAAERRRAPEATFAELAATLDMSRSQVQRAFELIGSAALHDVTDEQTRDEVRMNVTGP